MATMGDLVANKINKLIHESINYYTVKSRFNESRFKVKSRFKVQNLVTKMEFHIKKSRFRVKSRFKESKCADGGHSLNRDFTVFRKSTEVNEAV